MTRHAHEDVLTDGQFELLLEACSALPEPLDFEARSALALDAVSALPRYEKSSYGASCGDLACVTLPALLNPTYFPK